MVQIKNDDYTPDISYSKQFLKRSNCVIFYRRVSTLEMVDRL